MTLLKLGPLALSRSRFALSPLAETVGAIISLRRARPDPWMSAWYATHQASFDRRLKRDPFLRGLADLLSQTKWLPDVVALPPNGGMSTSLSAELESVGAMSDAEIRAAFEVSQQHSWVEQDLRWTDRADLGRSLASAVRTVWSRHVAPDWPRRREALEREVMYRAGLLAAYGWPKALEGMSRRSRWIGADSIQFSNRPGADRHIGDEGLQFVPVTLQGGAWLCESKTAGYALVYPARRAAVEFPADGRAALGRLIGRGRAELLSRLCRPGTASELAEELELSLGTVGRHLRILRDAGLIVGLRDGHKVVYRVTARGAELAGDEVAGDLGGQGGGEDR